METYSRIKLPRSIATYSRIELTQAKATYSRIELPQAIATYGRIGHTEFLRDLPRGIFKMPSKQDI